MKSLKYCKLLSLAREEIIGQNLLSEVVLGCTLCVSQRPPQRAVSAVETCPLPVLYVDHFHFSDRSSIFTVWAGPFAVLGSAASGRTLHWCGASVVHYHKYRSVTHQFSLSTSERIQAELDAPPRGSLGCR